MCGTGCVYFQTLESAAVGDIRSLGQLVTNRVVSAPMLRLLYQHGCRFPVRVHATRSQLLTPGSSNVVAGVGNQARSVRRLSQSPLRCGGKCCGSPLNWTRRPPDAAVFHRGAQDSGAEFFADETTIDVSNWRVCTALLADLCQSVFVHSAGDARVLSRHPGLRNRSGSAVQAAQQTSRGWAWLACKLADWVPLRLFVTLSWNTWQHGAAMRTLPFASDQ